MTGAEPVAPGRAVRVWPLNAAYALIWGALTLIPLSFAVGFADDFDPPPAGQLAVYAVLTVLFAVIVARALTMGVFVDDDGVRIRNVFTTRRVAWEDIASFSLGVPKGRASFMATGLVNRHDGTSVPAACLQPPLDATRWTRAALERLNATRAQRRA